MTKNKTDLTSANKPQSCPENEVSFPLQIMPQITLSSSSVKEISPIALAYIGDAIYELFIRCYYLMPPKKIADYHNQVVKQVRAETQAQHLQILQPELTDVELNWVRRGRNSVKKSPRRLPLQTYKQATGLETLLGYLYITDPSRLQLLLNKLNLGRAIN